LPRDFFDSSPLWGPAKVSVKTKERETGFEYHPPVGTREGVC